MQELSADPALGERIRAWLDVATDLRDHRRAAADVLFHPGPSTPPSEAGTLLRDGRVVRIRRVGALPEGRWSLVLRQSEPLVVEAIPVPDARAAREADRRLLAALADADGPGLPQPAARRLLDALRDPAAGDRWTDRPALDLEDAHGAFVLEGLTQVDDGGEDLGVVVETSRVARRLTVDAVERAKATWRQRDVPRVSPRVDQLFVARGIAEGLDLPHEPGPVEGIVSIPAGHREHAEAALADAPWIDRIAGDAVHAFASFGETGLRFDVALEDPPYGSGLDTLGYRDAWPPGAWTAMMGTHLGSLRTFLAPDGVAVLHIDEHRGPDLEQLVRERFGDGFLGTMIWDKRNPKGDSAGLAFQHERILWATPDPAALRARGGLRRTKANAERMLSKAAEIVGAHDDLDEARAAWRDWVRAADGLSGGERAYRHLDDDGEVFRPVSMAWPNKSTPADHYFEPLIHPVTGQPCPVPARGWRNTPQTMARLAAEGRILFGADHTTQPTRKYLLREQRREPVPSVIQHATSDDDHLARWGIRFPYAKPVALLVRLLDAANAAPDARILDAFAGSGSTAEAALRLSDLDDGARRVVLVERDPRVRREVLDPRLLHALLDGPGGRPRRALVRTVHLRTPGGDALPG